MAPGSASKPGMPEAMPDKATIRSDAAAELDRLAKKKAPAAEGTESGIDFNASDC